jgi:hypothetical protein
MAGWQENLLIRLDAQAHRRCIRSCSTALFTAFFLSAAAQTTVTGKDGFDLTVHEKQPMLIGRVMDAKMQPLASAQLKVTSPDTDLKITTGTKRDGSFQIAHDPCKICQLEVFPPKGSHLAPARLDNLSGESTRRLIIELHEGLEISGRILGNGKALKGVAVSIVPSDEKSSEPSSVHGSGLLITNKAGSFSMLVTPGQKKVTIENDRYPEFVKSFATQIDITAGGDIPDISLPTSETSEATKKHDSHL